MNGHLWNMISHNIVINMSQNNNNLSSICKPPPYLSSIQVRMFDKVKNKK